LSKRRENMLVSLGYGNMVMSSEGVVICRLNRPLYAV